MKINPVNCVKKKTAVLYHNKNILNVAKQKTIKIH